MALQCRFFARTAALTDPLSSNRRRRKARSEEGCFATLRMTSSSKSDDTRLRETYANGFSSALGP